MLEDKARILLQPSPSTVFTMVCCCQWPPPGPPPPLATCMLSTRNPSITAAGQPWPWRPSPFQFPHDFPNDHPLWWPKKMSAAELSCFPWLKKDAGITFQWKVLIQMFQTRPVHHCLILFDNLIITMVYHHPQWSTNSTPTKTIKRPALEPTETQKLMWR